jgi:hypothetical protein
MATARWEQRYRYIYARRVTEPRLTAEYEDISAAPQQLLHVITATLAWHYGVAYRYLWLNLYRTHRDSTSWHGDPIGKIQETSIVPVLSLGATRRFLIKPAQGGQSVSLAVASRRPDRHGRTRPARLAPLGAQAGHPGRPPDQHQLRACPALIPGWASLAPYQLAGSPVSRAWMSAMASWMTLRDLSMSICCFCMSRSWSC